MRYLMLPTILHDDMEVILPLYKFVERQFIESFFSTGSLKLGTLHDFKDTIEHGESRGDRLEGEHTLIRSIDGTLALSNNRNEPVISEVFQVEGDGEAYISNLSVIVPRASPDGFVFCTSKLFTEELFWKWHTENGVDACYEITDPRQFFSAITKKISNSAFFFRNANITYTKNPIPFNSPDAKIFPAFTKEANGYSWQEENRTLWGIKAPYVKLSPWIISVPDAIKCCRPVSVIDDGEIRYAKRTNGDPLFD